MPSEGSRIKGRVNAIVFLYRQVLKKELGRLEEVQPAKKPAKLPLVFTPTEVKAVLNRLEERRGSWRLSSMALACTANR